ncbi:cbb3-type cytochrome c oxidase subunit I [Paraflavitalea sp. CAU 1676]|uniref:cbb3-type cytochrome c oxidase subunit I n=1 Tax=Paraflavitalea sp. CAU 1676 TaxID=3032598 RepID=UPI0023DA9645|nr:cbb3-type cytochrome c oxidase subunit I [Paraflavitalea sp. CAU 1676]MDF2191662.1 cbb3-type cytochrome c oxidase subunit I [Paraflavitalea sp. CAU 1676]
MNPSGFSFHADKWLTGAIALLLFLIIVITWLIRRTTGRVNKVSNRQSDEMQRANIMNQVNELTREQLDQVLRYREEKKHHALTSGETSKTILPLLALVIGLLSSLSGMAQDTAPAGNSLLSQPGILITVILLLIPLLAALLILYTRVKRLLQQYTDQQRTKEANQLASLLSNTATPLIEQQLLQRKQSLEYTLHHHELSGTLPPADAKGLLHINTHPGLPVVPLKRKAPPRPQIDKALSKLILAYLISAAAWLLFGTTVGEYIGIKFVAPDADHIAWLSFGRLRPVHTNAVFWGWASLGMLGLGYYIVPRVSNAPLASIKKGWYALAFLNAAVVLGTISLMAGINNGGGEYREYIWPIMLLFAIGLLLSLSNFIQTIARRTTKEIYISNWYIVSAILFAITITVVAYIPAWQNGLGETIIQGYYMHQGVGMWFMLFTLGMVYYFLPQQLNKPIYSYSLGILAFWSQIFFYTLIGTHHFVFSAIPWWLQTIAIVGSVGMIIPVVAGTTNFFMTFRGAWDQLRDSYTLPFFLTGVVFYFTGSLQGTAEAFRFTNQLWHFTDFTVAHSHLTMYGIISFFLWACIYAVVPRLTGREAPQLSIGIHFWLALLGLLFYTIPLMIGSTLRGLMWMNGKPFIETVQFMLPYWLWRAIGGSMMWLSHIFFAWNLYRMVVPKKQVDITETAIQRLAMEPATVH